MNRLSTLTVAFLVVASAAGAGSTVGIASAQAGTEIDSCTTITEPGRYVLTTDIENSNAETCIDIATRDVVLDGNGHTIDGTDADGTTGIRALADRLRNVTIRDVTVTDWETGISLRLLENGLVTNVVARSNTNYGIGASEITSSTVTGSVVRSNGAGIGAFLFSERVTIADNTVEGNDRDGIYVEESSTFRIENNTVSGNGESGVFLNGIFPYTGSGSHVLVGNTLSGNAVGLTTSAPNTTVENTVARANSGADLHTASEFVEVNVTGTHFATDSATLSFESNDVALDAVESPPEAPENHRGVGAYVGATGTVDRYDDRDPDESSSLTAAIQYSDAAVENAGVSEDSLRLYTYAEGEWSEIPSSVDTEANTVSGTIENVPESGLVVAPLGKATDDGQDENDVPANGDDGDDGDDGQENGDDGDGDGDGDDQRSDTDEQDGKTRDGGEAPRPDDENGTDDGNEESSTGSDGNGGDDGSVVPIAEPITVEFAGIVLTFGPPTDPNGDGVYEDVTGDGSLDALDTVAHAGIVTAVTGDVLELTDEQTEALDVNGDGRLTYADAFALAEHANGT